MFNKIIVPLDGSQVAEQALKSAVAIAQQTKAQIILLQAPVFKDVIIPSEAGYGLLWPESSMEAVISEASDYLNNIQIQYTQPDLTLQTVIVEGDPASAIIDTALEEGADLIVMSTHGRTGLTRWVLGSVTEKVLRHAHCPVLVVRNEAPISNVIITLDGSPLAEQAVEPGCAITDLLGGEVTLVSVEQPIIPDAKLVRELDRAESGLGKHLLENLYNNTENYLQIVARTFECVDIHTKAAILTGSPANSILEYADEHDVDLIVMATHGRTGIRRWVYGSVTEKVLRRSHCAMLIVRPTVTD